jgi:Glu-tRNA(Gln) amidotransferase subunit E-like FAD-binding protein
MIKLLDAGKLNAFESLLKIIDDANFIGKVLLLFPKEIASHEKIDNIEEILTNDVIESIVIGVAKHKVKLEDVKHVMTEIAKGKSFDEAIKIEKIDSSEITGEIAKIVKEKPGLSIGGYMGLIMQKFKGKVSGKEATDTLNKLLNK